MISINKDLCVGCEICMKNCIQQKIIKTLDGAVKGPEHCLECGHCAALCPKGAVTIQGYDMTDVVSVPDQPVLRTEDVLLAIKSRRSIRNYTAKKIDQESVHVMMEAARYTATACNYQNSTYVFVQEHLDELKNLTYRFIDTCMQDPEKKDRPEWLSYGTFLKRKQADQNDDYLFRNAPAMIVIATNNIWDAGLQAQNIEFAAVSMGMGVLYNGFMTRLINESSVLKKWLGLEEKNAAAVMLVGYPKLHYLRTVPRKEANLIMR